MKTITFILVLIFCISCNNTETKAVKTVAEKKYCVIIQERNQYSNTDDTVVVYDIAPTEDIGFEDYNEVVVIGTLCCFCTRKQLMQEKLSLSRSELRSVVKSLHPYPSVDF